MDFEGYSHQIYTGMFTSKWGQSRADADNAALTGYLSKKNHDILNKIRVEERVTAYIGLVIALTAKTCSRESQDNKL